MNKIWKHHQMLHSSVKIKISNETISDLQWHYSWIIIRKQLLISDTLTMLYFLRTISFFVFFPAVQLFYNFNMRSACWGKANWDHWRLCFFVFCLYCSFKFSLWLHWLYVTLEGVPRNVNVQEIQHVWSNMIRIILSAVRCGF